MTRGKSKKGRPMGGDRPVWEIERENPERNVTIAVISMCIKDDLRQTFSELVKRVSDIKKRPYGECRAVLRELLNKGELGYYDVNFNWCKWEPGGKNEKV